MKSYGKLIVSLIAAWFLFALLGSAEYVFRNQDNRFGIAIALAAGLPLVIFAAWFGLSASFREYLLSLNPSTLTLAQTWRLLGFTFLISEARGILPAFFAWPAGYGDMLIGATATYIALRLAEPRHRSTFIGWQLLGITDLVLAVGVGTTAGLTHPGASMLAMTVLPFSLIPTFLVPLFFILHVICIAQAWSWKQASSPAWQPRTPSMIA